MSGAAPAAGRYDVAIVGAGLAGLSLARHLLLETGRTVLLLDRREDPAAGRQKVGESTVQLAGYYLSRVLDMEEHMFREQLLKYNLRFYWPTPGRDNAGLEDYSQCYIRAISNVASYQLDRNRFERALLERCVAAPRCTFQGGADGLEIELADEAGDAPHRLRYRLGDRAVEAAADWVVDATGRRRLLAKQLGMARPSPIRHGAYFCWVDGLVDVEKLTSRSRREVLLRRDRRELGHLPFWLATNHFVGEGFWFWVIPLQGRTSLGLVFDPERVARDEVNSAEKLLGWACRRFPLLSRELDGRATVDFAGFRDVSHGCTTTISAGRWALSGESGRFLDPLYSPGADFIALHNTLIVDAVEAERAELPRRCRQHEQLLRALYEAYVPGYVATYDALGDMECFVLKYAWELGVYFAFYVFPFLNHLFTDRRFLVSFQARFARLGPLNASLQALLAGYYAWKRERGLVGGPPEPACFDFTSVPPLARAADTFYRVGLDAGEARAVLDGQLANLEELVRWSAAHIASVVLGDERVLTDAAFVAALDPADLRFEPEVWARRWEEGAAGERWPWSFDPLCAAPVTAPGPAAAPADRSAAS